MDIVSLDRLLHDGKKRQFWLKPVGWPKDHPNWDVEELRTWTEEQVEIHFVKENVAVIAVGDVVVAYRINISKLIYVAERLPVEEWGGAEVRSEDSRRRWPGFIKARNLTREYGKVWKRYDLQPFPLAEEYNKDHPDDPARLGSIKRGNDKARIPRCFAEMLIRRIRDL